MIGTRILPNPYWLVLTSSRVSGNRIASISRHSKALSMYWLPSRWRFVLTRNLVPSQRGLPSMASHIHNVLHFFPMRRALASHLTARRAILFCSFKICFLTLCCSYSLHFGFGRIDRTEGLLSGVRGGVVCSCSSCG